MKTNLITILADYTVEEIEFLIHYYNDICSINDRESLIELTESEERIPGITLGIFGDMLESCYKVGTRGNKDKWEKLAQRFHNRYINQNDFFALTKAICSEDPEVASYIQVPYGC